MSTQIPESPHTTSLWSGARDGLRDRTERVGPNPGPLVADAVRHAGRGRSGRRARVLVIGNIGNGNVGDEAVFAGLAQHLCAAADITVVTHNPEGVSALHGVRAVKMVSPQAVRALMRTDVIAVGGGGIFGFGLPPLVRLLPFVLCLARLLLRKRLVFQAIGAYPGTPQPTLGALRFAGRLADAVLVRDAASLAVFGGRGLKPTLVGDPAIYLTPASPQDAWGALTSAGVQPAQPPLVISLKPTPDVDLTERMIDRLAQAADWWCEHRSSDVVVLPMSDIGDYGLGAASADAVLGQCMAEQLQEPGRVKFLPSDLTPALAKAIIGEASGVIAVRLHASIFAWSMGVPLLTLPFEEKTTTWLSQIDGTALPLSEISQEALVQWLRDL